MQFIKFLITLNSNLFFEVTPLNTHGCFWGVAVTQPKSLLLHAQILLNARKILPNITPPNNCRLRGTAEVARYRLVFFFN